MNELIMQTLDNFSPTLILLDEVDVNIPELISFYILDCNYLVLDNISNRFWLRIVLSDDPLETVYKW